MTAAAHPLPGSPLPLRDALAEYVAGLIEVAPPLDPEIRAQLAGLLVAPARPVDLPPVLPQTPSGLRRGQRRMPSLWTIARYWHTTGAHLLLLDPGDIGRPYCFGCDALVPTDPDQSPRDRWNSAGRWLDRAHLVDRAAGGLDGPQNVVALCLFCHRVMPVFRPEHGADAIRWVVHRPCKTRANSVQPGGEHAREDH